MPLSSARTDARQNLIDALTCAVAGQTPPYVQVGRARAPQGGAGRARGGHGGLRRGATACARRALRARRPRRPCTAVRLITPNPPLPRPRAVGRGRDLLWGEAHARQQGVQGAAARSPPFRLIPAACRPPAVAALPFSGPATGPSHSANARQSHRGPPSHDRAPRSTPPPTPRLTQTTPTWPPWASAWTGSTSSCSTRRAPTARGARPPGGLGGARRGPRGARRGRGRAARAAAAALAARPLSARPPRVRQVQDGPLRHAHPHRAGQRPAQVLRRPRGARRARRGARGARRGAARGRRPRLAPRPCCPRRPPAAARCAPSHAPRPPAPRPQAYGVGNMPDAASQGWLPWLREQTKKGLKAGPAGGAGSRGREGGMAGTGAGGMAAQAPPLSRARPAPVGVPHLAVRQGRPQPLAVPRGWVGRARGGGGMRAGRAGAGPRIVGALEQQRRTRSARSLARARPRRRGGDGAGRRGGAADD